MRLKMFFLVILAPSILKSQVSERILQLNKFDLKEGLKIQNDVREFYDLEKFTLDDELSKKAQLWANHLAVVDSLVISDDEYGENVFWVDIEYIDTYNKNIFKEASLNWVLTKGEEDENSFLQIISEKSTKIGIGIASSLSNHYVVAKYDSIY